MSDRPFGRRALNRERTRLALEESALAVVLEYGYRKATVESICARAGVSTRTFFNYFESKDDALLGLHEMVLTAKILREHGERYAGAPAIESAVGLIMLQFGHLLGRAQSARTQVLSENPQLHGRILSHIEASSQATITFIGSLLGAGEPADGGGPDAHVVHALCFSAVRRSAARASQAGKELERSRIEADAGAAARLTCVGLLERGPALIGHTMQGKSQFDAQVPRLG